MRLESRELLPGHVSVTPILFGDPAYPLLLNVMKEFNNCTETKHVLFNNKFAPQEIRLSVPSDDLNLVGEF